MNSGKTFQDQLREQGTMKINAICSQQDYRNFCNRAKAEGVIPADAFSALVSLYAHGGDIIMIAPRIKDGTSHLSHAVGVDYVKDHSSEVKAFHQEGEQE